MYYLVFSILLVYFTFTQADAMEKNAPTKEPKPYEIKEEESKEFLHCFNNLPKEIKSLVLEYVHNDLFEPSIGTEGAYVQKKRIPDPLTKYWKNLKHYRVRRFTWPDLETGPIPIYFQNELYVCDADDKIYEDAKEICKEILGPNKQGILINPAKLTIGNIKNLYINKHNVLCFEQHSLTDYMDRQKKIKFSLHPDKNLFFTYQKNSTTNTTAVALFSYNNETPIKYQSFELSQEFHEMEYDFKHPDGKHLLAVSKACVYEIGINECAREPKINICVLPILTPTELAKFEYRELALPGKKLSCGDVEKIVQSKNNHELMIINYERLFSFLYNRKNNQILKSVITQKPVFCQYPDIFKHSKNGPEKFDVFFVISPKKEFLQKRLANVNAAINKILKDPR